MEQLSDFANKFNKFINDLKNPQILKCNYLSINQLLNWVLSLLILYGLFIKLQLALSISLNSDDVSAGMVSREVFVHGNSLLQGYYFPSPDPHIFSEYVPFHFLPQLFSGFDAKVLVLSSYFIFVFIVVIYSVLIYNMTKNITSSLIFAALLTNIPNLAGDYFFVRPTQHMATILFIGILLLIYRHDIPGRLFSILYLLILAFVSFSDSLLILWYFIPFFVTHALLNKPYKMSKLNFLFISGITVLLFYLVKEHIQTFIKLSYKIITSGGQISNNILLLFNGIFLLYNNKL